MLYAYLEENEVISGSQYGYHYHKIGRPCGSDGKESACNVEDLSFIPGLGRLP